MAAELISLISGHLPGTPVYEDVYPSRATLSGLLSAHEPGLCFLDVDTDREAAFRVMSDLTARQPGPLIVVLLSGNDPDVILRCLRQGAGEFLIRPFTADQLKSALEKLSRLQPAGGHSQESAGRLYCVMPGKGACGATSIACNLAFHFKRLGAKRVLLADMDPLTGTVAFLLKLKSNYSFVDALAYADRLDADLWKVLVTPSSGVDVLLSPEDPVNGFLEGYDPGPLAQYCRRTYEAVILDSSGAYGDWNLALARLSDELLLVTTNDLASLHATQRALAYLTEQGMSHAQVRLVVNRYYPAHGLAAAGIEAALQSEVYHTLPSDYEAIQRALMDGKPVGSGSRFGRSMATLADRLAGREESAKNSSVLSGLGSLFGRR